MATEYIKPAVHIQDIKKHSQSVFYISSEGALYLKCARIGQYILHRATFFTQCQCHNSRSKSLFLHQCNSGQLVQQTKDAEFKAAMPSGNTIVAMPLNKESSNIIRVGPFPLHKLRDMIANVILGCKYFGSEKVDRWANILALKNWNIWLWIREGFR